MNRTMKAICKTKPELGAIEVLEVPLAPSPLEEEVRIRVESVGVCGTDLSLYKWTENAAKEYHPKLPVILGHEFAGIVEQVGERVTNVKVGDKVAVNPHISCGKCQHCKKGREGICKYRPVLGCHTHGGLTQYVTVRAGNVYKLPDHVPVYLGGLAEPLAVTVHALERVQTEDNPKDQVVVIVGCGTIGLLQYMVCKAAGYKNIVILGLTIDKERLELAESIGAKTINVEEENWRDKMKKLTNQEYADVVFEVAGTNESVQCAIDIAGTGTKIGLLGITAAKTPIDTSRLVFEEKELIGCRAHNYSTWPKTMEIMGKIVPEMERIVTHRYSLFQTEDALHRLMKRDCLKIIIDPSKLA